MERGHSHHRSRPQNIKYFLNVFAAHKVESANLESTVFLESLLSLSLSLLIHINSTNIYGWTFVKHQRESDLGRNKMTLLLFANYF